MFLIQRNCGSIVQKGKDTNVALSDTDRKTLIGHVHSYLALRDTTEGDMAGFVSILNRILIVVSLDLCVLTP